MRKEDWIKIKSGCNLPTESTGVLFGIRVNGKETYEVALYHADTKSLWIPTQRTHATIDKIINAPAEYDFFWKDIERLPDTKKMSQIEMPKLMTCNNIGIGRHELKDYSFSVFGTPEGIILKTVRDNEINIEESIRVTWFPIEIINFIKIAFDDGTEINVSLNKKSTAKIKVLIKGKSFVKKTNNGEIIMGKGINKFDIYQRR